MIAIPWLKIGGVALIALAVWQYGNGRYDAGEDAEREKWEKVVRQRESEIAQLRLTYARREADASNTYAAKLESIEPIIIRSTDTVTRYAQTPAGSALCLPAERVFDIDATAAALGLRDPGADASADGQGEVRTNADRAER